jgi:hypothetical protein
MVIAFCTIFNNTMVDLHVCKRQRSKEDETDDLGKLIEWLLEYIMCLECCLRHMEHVGEYGIGCLITQSSLTNFSFSSRLHCPLCARLIMV